MKCERWRTESNGCMERSMNGRALPPDGLDMKAEVLTYIRFISNRRT